MQQPMANLATDLEFWYEIAHNSFGWDFWSALNDSLAGHFAFFIRPSNYVTPDQVLDRKMVFILSTSTSMSGYKLESSVAAVTTALGQLNENDWFNIISYDYWYDLWQTNLVQATTDNVAAATTWLEALSTSGGNRLDIALDEALEQFTDASYSNSIIVFTDGRSPLDPVEVATGNQHQVGIFPVAFGDDVDRSRLELTAQYNHGFVTYLDEDDNLIQDLHQLFQIINQPIFRNVSLEFNKDDVHDLIPTVYPTVFAGSYFYVTGRYHEPGEVSCDFWGDGIAGAQQYGFGLDYSAVVTDYGIPAYLWAKNAIDAIDRTIDVYGETETLKDSSIALSLRYKIRSRYTAYLADYENIIDPPISVIPADAVMPDSYLLKAFPNPFNPSTTIEFYLNEQDAGKPVYLRLYDLRGRLVMEVRLEYTAAGWYRVMVYAFDAESRALPAGLYLAVLQTSSGATDPLKLLLLK